MTSAEEREIEKLNSGRILREASKQLLPFLDHMRRDCIARICTAHKEQEHQSLAAHAAELSVLEDLRAKIERSNKETEKREEKIYGN
jgi:hypothetical protein